MILAIIGAGSAGRSLAEKAVAAGHRVILEDVLPSKLRGALAEIQTAGRAGILETALNIPDAVRNADIVVDFVPDELESKLELVSMVDRMAPPKTMLCIPTSALSISDLASCTYRADRCIGVQIDGTHLRLVTGRQTSDDTVALCQEFWRSLNYVPHLQAEPSDSLHETTTLKA